MHEEGTEAEYAATALLQQSRAALAGETATPVTPAWQSTIARAEPERCATDDNSTAAIDVQFAEGACSGPGGAAKPMTLYTALYAPCDAALLCPCAALQTARCSR